MKASPFVESDVGPEMTVLGKSCLGESPDTFEKRVQFRGLTTTSYRGNYRRDTTIPERRGRILSSTMPGFSSESKQQRAFRDGIRLAEVRSGRKFVETQEDKKQRKKNNGEAMYAKSSAVPESMIQFADDIHREERITRKEEIELGELTQEAVRLQKVYDSLKDNLDREPTNEEWCAASGKINIKALEQAIEQGFEAKNRLVTSNLRMVQSVVNTYIRNGLSSQYNAGDMMQEGILALIRAAEKFEPGRGWKFSTYAMYWVRASVKRNQLSQSRPVPIPHRHYDHYKRLIRVQRKLEISLNRKPTKRELGEAVGLSEVQVSRCFDAIHQKYYSLDEEIRNTLKPNNSLRKDRLIEIVESKAGDAENNLNSAFLREAFVETLQRHLNDQEVEILLLRYGMKDCPEHTKIGRQPTVEELSRTVGLKPDKVRRIINKALKQLRAVNPEEWYALAKEIV